MLMCRQSVYSLKWIAPVASKPFPDCKLLSVRCYKTWVYKNLFPTRHYGAKTRYHNFSAPGFP